MTPFSTCCRFVAGSSLLLLLLTPQAATAGAFISADESDIDEITHPEGYDGTGGVVEVSVCIDPSISNADDLVIPVKNIVREINRFGASTPNLILGGANDIAVSEIDFESLTLHELGHCLGLHHPNLATESGVASADRNYTKSTDGADDTFDLDDGADGIKGSSDDLRDDDIPFHWFEIAVNNPFVLPGKVDSSTHSLDTADLPPGHDYVANADRTVGAALGFSDTEAVMQQGQFFDEDQRRLQADDIVTFLFGMSGLDETAGTADDYTIHLVYAGKTTSCDIPIEPVTSGLGFCSLSTSTPDFMNYPDHFSITDASFSYNTTLDWYFNPTLNCADLELDWEHDQLVAHEVCNDITLEDGFSVGPDGDVELQAGGTVTFETGVSVAGSLQVIIDDVAP